MDFVKGYTEYHDGDAKDLEGIETPDDYTVVFHLEKPRIDAESVLGTQGICSDQTLNYKQGKTAKIEKKNTKPVGTGPYVLKSYDKSIGASLEKNSYFKAEKGTVDYISDVTDADKNSSVIQSKSKDLTLDSYNGDRTNWLYLNTADGPCKDQAVRQALA